MALATPGVYVEATPTLTPPRYGLLTAATDLVSETDPHLLGGGAFTLPSITGDLKYMDADCEDPFDPLEFDTGMEWHKTPPINTYWGWTCKLPGLDASAEQRVRDRLINGESPALEHAIWSGLPIPTDDDPDLVTGLMSPDTQVLTTQAVDLSVGIGALERHLWDVYGGTPVIHAPREIGARLAEKQLLVVSGGKARTPLESVYSLGSYPRTGKDGADAAAGTAWLVGSGQVTVRRGQVESWGTQPQSSGINARTNEVFWLALRKSVVSWDSITAAVLVNV